MSKKLFKERIVPGIMIATVLLLTGCGTNLFEGFVEAPVETDPAALLETANSPEEYEQVEQAAIAIISDESATSENVQEALIAYSEASLGSAEVSSIDLVTGIASAADDSNSDNIVNNLSDAAGVTDENGDVPTSTVASVLIAGLSSNAASELSELQLIGNSLSIAESNDGGLDANDTFTRMVANALATFVLIVDVINIDADGDITTKDGGETDYFQILEQLIEPDLPSDVTGFLDIIDPDIKARIDASPYPLGVAYFGNECIDAITSGQVDIFTQEQIDIISKIQTYTAHMFGIYEAMTDNTSYTFTPENGGAATTATFTSGMTDEQRSTEIQTILEAVFSDFQF